MIRILIVDDDMHLRRLVNTYGTLEGFICGEAADGREALEKIAGEDYDIIVLDVLMPGPDGFETLGEIRKLSQTPVIMLTSRSEEYDKLKGFKLGADDYICKPFSPNELIARIKAVLKRSSSSGVEFLKFGELTLSPETRDVTLAGASLTLSPKEFDLLHYLVRNEKLVLSRDQLLDKVWGYDFYGDARTIDTHVKSLREHLGAYRKYIKTVWGIGYKFEYKENE